MPHPTLRHATLKDVPALLELAKDLHDLWPYKDMLRLDTKKTVESFERFIISDQSEHLALLSYEGDELVGALLAYAIEPLMSPDKIAIEVFWYIKPEHRSSSRGRDMMQAYEYWAKLVGVKVVHYGWLNTSPPEMKKLYLRNGCVLSEETYVKEIK